MKHSAKSSKEPTFGLQALELAQIIQVLQRHPEVDKGVLFGSRAKNCHKKGSDVDIALVGKDLDRITTIISSELNEETLLPYTFDVIDYNRISNFALKEHIDRCGVLLYKKSPVE